MTLDHRLHAVGAIVLALVGCGSRSTSTSSSVEPAPLRPVADGELRAVSDFAGIHDPAARSKALYMEMSRVLMHPRCINCHPDGDVPFEGMNLALHDPIVQRGRNDTGVPGMECSTCHQDRNQELNRVPGAPRWHLAPRETAWVGKSAAYICAQLKDPMRNGGKSLDEIIEHNGKDDLIAWGWAPGADREPAPGTQAQFGELTAAWVETGAECPEEGK